MLTQCPHCQTIFRVTQDVLAVADGEVRCGRCGTPFDGIKGFVDHHQLLAARRSSNAAKGATASSATSEYAATRPIHNEPANVATKPPTAKDIDGKGEGKSKGPDAIAPTSAVSAAVATPAPPADIAAMLMAPAAPVAPAPAPATKPTIALEKPKADDAASAIPKKVAKEPAAKGSTTADDKASATGTAARIAPDITSETAPEIAPEGAPDMEWMLRRPQKPRSWGAWKFVVPTLLVLLGIQIVHYFRQDIASNPRFGPSLIAIYTELGLYLAPHWRLQDYEVRQLGVLANPSTPGTLRVRASITNRATFAQPYPLLRLVLEDRFGQQVQAREFEPGEYAQKIFDGKSRLSPNQRIDASLTIVDPGTQAEGFRFDVCLRQPSGVFCAEDETPVL